MARYFFNLSDGSYEPDTQGTDLPDDETAQREGIRFAGEVMRHEPRYLQQGRLCVDVSTADGTVLFVIQVGLIDRKADVRPPVH